MQSFFPANLGIFWAKILRTPKNLPAPTPVYEQVCNGT